MALNSCEEKDREREGGRERERDRERERKEIEEECMGESQEREWTEYVY